MKNHTHKVIIVDDELQYIEQAVRSISLYPELRLMAATQNPDEGKELILKHQPDILFLDVEMPRQTGVELLDDLRDRICWPMQVVFYTAYDKYLLQALRASAFDYLLKPYTEDEMQLVIERFLKQATSSLSSLHLKESLSALLPEKKCFMITTPTGYQLLRVSDIGYFEYHSIRKIWGVILSDGKKQHLKRCTKAEDILTLSSSFIQISQHTIVNFDYMSIIDGQSCKMLPPFHNAELKISRSFFKRLQDRFESI